MGNSAVFGLAEIYALTATKAIAISGKRKGEEGVLNRSAHTMLVCAVLSGSLTVLTLLSPSLVTTLGPFCISLDLSLCHLIHPTVDPSSRRRTAAKYYPYIAMNTLQVKSHNLWFQVSSTVVVCAG